MLEYCLKNKDKIDLAEFTHINEKIASEMFLCVLFTSYLDFHAYEKANTFLQTNPTLYNKDKENGF